MTVNRRKNIREIIWNLIYMDAYDISEEDIQRVKDSLDSVSSKNKEVSRK